MSVRGVSSVALVAILAGGMAGCPSETGAGTDSTIRKDSEVAGDADSEPDRAGDADSGNALATDAGPDAADLAVDPGPLDTPVEASDPGPRPDDLGPVDAGPDTDAIACQPPQLTPCPETACGTVEDLADGDAILAYLRSATWNLTGPMCTVMGEVRVSGTYEIGGDSFGDPAWCQDGGCATRFRMSPAVPGITCLDPAGSGSVHCNRVRIESTSFRVRAGREYVDGFAPKTYALLELLGPCAAECAASELSCPNHTCWIHAYLHCGGCLGGTADVCACRDADGPVADGTECYWASGDVMGRGSCQCGVCVH